MESCKMKMSEKCKAQLTTIFRFSNDELDGIERFINSINNESAAYILDTLLSDENLNQKQKIVISYIVGNSVREIFEYEKEMLKKEKFKDMNVGEFTDGVPYAG